MGLVFSDSQIKTISDDIINLPKIIDFPLDPITGNGGSGLVQQQQNVIATKQALYVTDQQNKLFSDHWINTINAYHSEYELLSLVKKTNYDPLDLENGGKSLPPHYTSTHTELVPIVIDSNNGNPTTASAYTENEVPKLARLDTAISNYLNGITGALDDFTTDSWTDNQPVTTLNGTAFTVGEFVFVTQGSNAMLAQVVSSGGSCTGEAPSGSGVDESTCSANGGVWSTDIVLQSVSTPLVFTSGAKIQNYSPAWTDAQRGRQISIAPEDLAIMEILEAEIDLKFTDVNTYIQSIQTVLSNNEDTNQTRKASNQTYLGNLNNKLAKYSTWINSTIIAVDGKYTDDKLPPLHTLFSELSTLNPSRISQIVTDLGSVTDNGGGNITGDGAYFDLWKFIIIRIAKSGGTLYSWYGMDLAVSHFDVKIANANSQLTEYSNIMYVKKFTVDALIGENIITIENVTNLSQNDSIKVFDSASTVFTTSIQSISGNTVTLNQSIPFDLPVGNVARLVKLI